MVKRKKHAQAMPMGPMETTPATRRKWSAESMARTLIETDPRTRRKEDAITSAVLAAGQKALKTARRAK